VFAALKLPKDQTAGVLRISFSYDSTQEDVDALSAALAAAQKQLLTKLS
jgi:cysteine desulfurase